MIQEAVMDSDLFSSDHETDPNWGIAKQFFRELVDVTRRKVRYPGEGEMDGGVSLAGLDKDDKEAFESWRRDAGEIIVGAYVSFLSEEKVARIDSRS